MHTIYLRMSETIDPGKEKTFVESRGTLRSESWSSGGAACWNQIMREVEDIIEKVARVKDGFKPIRDLADEALALAYALYRSEVHQARMLATILLGRLSVAHPEAFDFLHDVISQDPDWRTQEMLAMAFDTYCKGVGYEQALPTIENWLGDPNHNVRRAV